MVFIIYYTLDSTDPPVVDPRQFVNLQLADHKGRQVGGIAGQKHQREAGPRVSDELTAPAFGLLGRHRVREQDGPAQSQCRRQAEHALSVATVRCQAERTVPLVQCDRQRCDVSSDEDAHPHGPIKWLHERAHRYVTVSPRHHQRERRVEVRLADVQRPLADGVHEERAGDHVGGAGYHIGHRARPLSTLHHARVVTHGNV